MNHSHFAREGVSRWLCVDCSNGMTWSSSEDICSLSLDDASVQLANHSGKSECVVTSVNIINKELTDASKKRYQMANISIFHGDVLALQSGLQ
jgi:hypothetical protein